MIDPEVERQYSDTKELLALWNTFHQFFSMGVKGDNITPEKENQFLELKSRIAMLHDSFMDALTHNQNVGQEVLSIITRAITLKHLGRISTADLKKMEIEWHEAYLLLNDTIAALDQRRKELGEINESQYRAKQAAGAARQKMGKFFGSFYFKLAAVLAVLLAGTIGVQAFGIYDYDELGSISALRTPYRWGKYVVRTVNPDSPWPNIDVVPRKGHASWPEGVKEPQLDGDVDKTASAQMIAQLANPMGIFSDLYQNLNNAVEFRKETAEKGGARPVEIHSFRFNTAEEARQAYEVWDDAKTSTNTHMPVIDQMDFVLKTNVVVVIIAPERELLWKMVGDVYGKRA